MTTTHPPHLGTATQTLAHRAALSGHAPEDGGPFTTREALLISRDAGADFDEAEFLDLAREVGVKRFANAFAWSAANIDDAIARADSLTHDGLARQMAGLTFEAWSEATCAIWHDHRRRHDALADELGVETGKLHHLIVSGLIPPPELIVDEYRFVGQAREWAESAIRGEPMLVLPSQLHRKSLKAYGPFQCFRSHTPKEAAA